MKIQSLLVTVAATVLATCAPVSALAAGSSGAPVANSAPAPAPAGAPGTVISAHHSPDLIASLSPLAPHANVITYITTLDNGTPTVATATVYEPTAAWHGPGPRPTVVMAPGTRGQGDQCAPSRAGLHVANLNVGNSGASFNSNYEYIDQQTALFNGVRVVIADYIGLGTPGLHSYTNTLEEAHAVLDAARAGLAFSGQPANSPVGFAGYSQGGGAAAAAAEYAASYAPELNVKGTYAGAPPADLKVVMEAVDGSAISHVLAYALNGYIERNPAVGEAIAPLLNERGRQFLRSAATSCVVDSTLTWGLTRTNTLTTTGESMGQIMRRIPLLSETMDRQKLGQHPVTGPIMIVNSRTDDIIPFAQAKELGGNYCRQGGTVMLVAEPAAPQLVGAGLGHMLPSQAAGYRGLMYLLDRFRDIPAPSNCQ